MPTDLLITIITLSYNSDNLLQSVGSVLMQDYCRIEYIMVDDCSDEFDEAAVRDYVKKHSGVNITDFRLLRNERNLGTVRSLNRAIAASTGKYVFNLAGDDSFHDEYVITEWVAEFERTGADVITAKRVFANGSGRHKGLVLPEKRHIKLLRNCSPRQLFEKLTGSNFILGCCTARSRGCIEKNGLFDERYRLIEDYPMNLRLLRNDVRIYFWNRVAIDYSTSGVSAPLSISSVYDEDSKSIFRNEVLPYTQNKRLAKIKYNRWRKGNENEKRYQNRLHHTDSKSLIRLYRLMHNLRHPLTAVRKIQMLIDARK